MVKRITNEKATKTAVEELGRKATTYETDFASTDSVTALVPTILKEGHRIGRRVLRAEGSALSTSVPAILSRRNYSPYLRGLYESFI